MVNAPNRPSAIRGKLSFSYGHKRRLDLIKFASRDFSNEVGDRVRKIRRGDEAMDFCGDFFG